MVLTIDIARIHPQMGSPALPWPARKTDQAAGWDCVAAIDAPLELWPGRLVKVPLGFALGLPRGWEAQVRPRSGLAARGVTMPNSPGTVDADYRGEVSALLFCLPQYTREGDDNAGPYLSLASTEGVAIKPGDRICQLVIAAVPEVAWRSVPRASLTPTERGCGGFGSTGVSTAPSAG